MNKELQLYKNDYYKKMLDGFLADLINLREGAKSELVDLARGNCDKKQVLGNAEFYLGTIDEVLRTHQIVAKGEEYYLNNQLIYPSPNVILPVMQFNTGTGREKQQLELGEVVAPEEASMSSLLELFKEYQARLEKIYNAFDLQSKAINEVYNTAKLQQNAADGHFITPIAVKLIMLFNNVTKRVNSINDCDDESASTIYQNAIEYALDFLTRMLNSLDVDILQEQDLVALNSETEKLDLKYYRILNKIKPEELEGKKLVADQYMSDCYLYNGRILVPAKVKVRAE